MRQQRLSIRVVSVLTLLAVARIMFASELLDLVGKWSFRLDPQDVGVKARWFDAKLPDEVHLPGSLQEQGYGNEVSLETRWTGNIIDQSWFESPRYADYRRAGNIKVPFWLQPDKHYLGAAWYQRQISFPESWRGKRLVLTLERCHWETTVWLDDRRIGVQDSLSTPHVFVLSESANPGQHRLTVRVDNRMIVGVGVNAHSVSDHTQSNWNGIVGHISLQATNRVWIEDVQVYVETSGQSRLPATAPAEQRTAAVTEVVVTLGNVTGKPVKGRVQVSAKCPGHDVSPVSADFAIAKAASLTVRLPMGERLQRWDEFHPVLYELTTVLETGDPDGSGDGPKLRDSVRTSFGARSITATGRQLLLNGHPLSLRGTLECCIFPKTGYPHTSIDDWKRIINVCKAHGLNHMRFHSWCPPEAAFKAADQLGFYYQVECSAWVNQGSTVGEGKPIDRWLYREADRILKGLRQPSVVPVDGLRQRAGRPRPGRQVSGPLGAALSRERPSAALHRRRRLADDPREPIPQHAETTHPTMGPGAGQPDQCPATGDGHRLP